MVLRQSPTISFTLSEVCVLLPAMLSEVAEDLEELPATWPTATSGTQSTRFEKLCPALGFRSIAWTRFFFPSSLGEGEKKCSTLSHWRVESGMTQGIPSCLTSLVHLFILSH